MRWLLGALLLFGCSCGGSPGTLVDAGTDVTFVKEDGVLVGVAPEGIIATTLDGSARRVLFADARSIKDVSSDFQVWVANDKDTNMFVGDLATGAWRRVPELDGVFSDAAVSPDGRTVAASRHADFSASKGPDQDTIFLVDVGSLRVDTIPKASERWPTKIRWAEDGGALFVQWAHHEGGEWIELESKRRTATSKPLAPLDAPHRTEGVCRSVVVHEKFATEIQVERERDDRVVVARIEGRKRGFHDYLSDFGRPVLTPDCGYVMFEWTGGVWLADAAGSGTNGPLLTAGYPLFFADARVLSGAK